MTIKKEDYQHIVDQLENLDVLEKETNYDGEPMTAFDYVLQSLDIDYLVTSHGEYKGARLLVTFGGPNITIDTFKKTIEIRWWGDSLDIPYYDGIGLDDACEEYFTCSREARQ
jgi:hypothetical protein